MQSSHPVSIPEPSRRLPYSRLSQSANSGIISPSPTTAVLAAAADSLKPHSQGSLQDYGIWPSSSSAAAAQQGGQGLTLPTNTQRSAHYTTSTGTDQQPHKRPPLPPSPQARAQGGSLNPLAPAWVNPAGSGGSSSGGRHSRQLAAAATAGSSGSYRMTGLLSASIASGSRGSLQQAYGTPSPSPSPGGGLLSAALSAEDAAAAAGNPYHPQHDQAMQMLMQHQAQQLLQLQQQQQHNSSSYAGTTGRSPGSPRVLSRNSSYSRLSELGTSPGLVEASFMGMAARHNSSFSAGQQQRGSSFTHALSASAAAAGGGNGADSSGSFGAIRSATLQQLLSGQQNVVRQQQEQQQRHLLHHSRSASSFTDWAAAAAAGGGGSGSSYGGSSSHSLRPPPGSQADTPISLQGWAPLAHQQLQQQQGNGWSGTSTAPSRGGSSGSSSSRVMMGSEITFDSGLDVPTLQQQQQRGMRALPGRPGLHWLSRADETESAARGLLGLPRPGIMPRGRPLPLQQQQLQQLRAQQQQWQQQQEAERGGAGVRSCETVVEGLRQHALSSSVGDTRQQQQQAVLSEADPAAGAAAAAAAAAANGTGDAASAAGAAGYTAGATGYTSAEAGPPVWSREQLIALLAAYPSPAAGGAPAGSFINSSSQLAAAVAGGNSSRSFFPRSSSSRSLVQQLSFGRERSGGSSGMPTCLICLDALTPADFESGEAMTLACRCKGEVALRHRQCAEKWSRIKGNTTCDVCKAPILNLPDVPPLPQPPQPSAGADNGLMTGGVGLWGLPGDEPPAAADYMFDCIRVTWVVLIVCILFLELSVNTAFLIGAVAGCAWVAVVACCSAGRRWRRLRREAATAAVGGWEHEHHVPLMLGTAATDNRASQWLPV